jgi:F0F1-type ATP synthase membrane subunit b/b'
MATLNLIPNPMVLGAQVGVFLANFVAVKKLFVEPYLSVRDRRQALTVGSQDEAAKALAKSEELTSQIERQLVAAASEAKAEREKIRDKALAKRSSLLAVAEADAKEKVAAVEREIQGEVKAETAKIPAVVQTLTDEVYRLAMA